MVEYALHCPEFLTVGSHNGDHYRPKSRRYQICVYSPNVGGPRPFFRLGVNMRMTWYCCISASEGRRDLVLGLNEAEHACLFMSV